MIFLTARPMPGPPDDDKAQSTGKPASVYLMCGDARFHTRCRRAGSTVHQPDALLYRRDPEAALIFLTARPMPGPPDDDKAQSTGKPAYISNVRRRSLPHTLPACRQYVECVLSRASAWACRPPSANMRPDPKCHQRLDVAATAAEPALREHPVSSARALLPERPGRACACLSLVAVTWDAGHRF